MCLLCIGQATLVVLGTFAVCVLQQATQQAVLMVPTGKKIGACGKLAVQWTRARPQRRRRCGVSAIVLWCGAVCRVSERQQRHSGSREARGDVVESTGRCKLGPDTMWC